MKVKIKDVAKDKKDWSLYKLAKELGLPVYQLEQIGVCGMLHDVGKVATQLRGVVRRLGGSAAALGCCDCPLDGFHVARRGIRAIEERIQRPLRNRRHRRRNQVCRWHLRKRSRVEVARRLARASRPPGRISCRPVRRDLRCRCRPRGRGSPETETGPPRFLRSARVRRWTRRASVR